MYGIGTLFIFVCLFWGKNETQIHTEVQQNATSRILPVLHDNLVLFCWALHTKNLTQWLLCADATVDSNADVNDNATADVNADVNADGNVDGNADGNAMQWSKKVFVKPEFEVAKRMVSLLYFQVLLQKIVKSQAAVSCEHVP